MLFSQIQCGQARKGNHSDSRLFHRVQNLPWLSQGNRITLVKVGGRDKGEWFMLAA